MNFEIKKIPRQSYQKTNQMMLEFRDQRLKNQIPDQILILEHEPVITTGRKPVDEDLLISKDDLKQKGIEYISTDRGGKLTYHGPGQLVVYFIFDLNARKLSIKDWVYLVEEMIIQFLKNYHLTGERDCKNPGIWIGNNKIASLGFHIHRGITTHGLSLNINPDLKVYDFFIACGLKDRGITSLTKELNRDFKIEEVINLLIDQFRTVL